MKAYKFLADGARGRFSDLAWPSPHDGSPGDWIAEAGPIDECRRGIHAVTPEQLLEWLDDELWEVELDGPVERADSAVVALRARLVRRVDAWDDATAAAFAASCVDAAKGAVSATLRRLGAESAASGLAAAASVGDVVAVAAFVEEPTMTLVVYVADLLLLAAGARPDERPGDRPVPPASAIAANVGFVAAHVVGCAAGDGYEAAFAAERLRQQTWLRARLEL